MLFRSESLEHNIKRRNANLKFFEFGNVYHFNPEKKNEENPIAAYSENHHMALWLTGKRVQGSWIHADEDTSYFELEAYIRNILSRIGMQESMVVRKKSDNEIFSSGVALENRGGRKLVEMGGLSKNVLKAADIDVPVYYAELDWDALMKATVKNKVLYKEICKYPAVSRDLALLIDKNIEFAQIVEIARQTEKKLLKNVELFDVYEGKNLPEGKKSYAVNFILQDETKTLNDKQIDVIMNKLITNLKNKLGAELR